MPLTRRGALAGAACLTACGRPPSDITALTVAMPTLAEGTFLPWTGGGQRKPFLDAIYDYLCIIDPDTGEPGPGLASGWMVTSDGLEWTFSLRPGVNFQRGYGEVSSADVAFSIRQIIRPSARAGPSSPLRRLIKEIATPDPRTVVIRLTRPDPELAKGYLANAQQVGIVSARHVEEAGERAANAAPVGSGPFELEYFRRDSEVRLAVRADTQNIWRAKPAFRTLVFRAVPEVSTRVAMMKTGEADIAPISYDDIGDVGKAGLGVRSIPQSWSPVIRLGGLVQEGDRYEARNPWADVRVRQAMNYAIDKEAIIRRIFSGQGRVAASDTPVAAWSELEIYRYDPDRARALLAEAGYGQGFPVTLKTFATTPGAELPVVAQAVALYWRAVGINVSTELIDWTSLRSAWTSGAARGYVWTHRGFPFTSAQNGLEAGFDAKSVFSAFSTPELQAMLNAHAGDLDPATRREKLVSIGQYLRDQAANVFIAHIDEPYATSAKVGEWIITSSNALNFEGIQPAASGGRG